MAMVKIYGIIRCRKGYIDLFFRKFSSLTV